METFWAKIGNPKFKRTVALAFTIPNGAVVKFSEASSLSWTEEGATAFLHLQRAIRDATSNPYQHLPFASLRVLLEIHLQAITRVYQDVGLRNPIPRGELPKPFLWFTDDLEAASKRINEAIDEWFYRFLHIDKKQERLKDQLLTLHTDRKLYVVRKDKSKILPWNQNDYGTAHRPDGRSFQALTEYVFRLLANQELFDGRGGMRRIVNSDSFNSGLSLITDPINVGKEDKFSLMANLKVATFPGYPQPVLLVDFTKRRWLQQHPPDRFLNSISGYVFPLELTDRAIEFSIHRKKDKASDNGKANHDWFPDEAFNALKLPFKLPMKELRGSDIALGHANSEKAKVFLVYRHGLTDNSHDIDGGVPELDKLEGFDRIASLLVDSGLEPLDGLNLVETNHKSRSTPTAALLRIKLDEEHQKSRNGFLRKEDLKNLTKDKLKKHLEALIKSEQDETEDVSEKKVRLKDIIKANEESIKKLYPKNRPQLVILHEEHSLDDMELLKVTTEALWGNSLEIKPQHLPEDVHGARDSLPGNQSGSKDRFLARIKSWQKLAEQIGKSKNPTLCLVMASLYYDGKRDDKVNKRAGYKALAATGKAAVQYLLPPRKKDKSIYFDDFLIRAQKAMQDVVLVHGGYFESVSERVTQYFDKGEQAPQKIIGITIIRRNSMRGGKDQNSTSVPVAFRLDVPTGSCEMRYACERNGQLFLSAWRPLRDSLSEIAEFSPLQIGEQANVRFMSFCDSVVTESVEAGHNPLVLIDSTNSSSLWHWLRDSDINLANIKLGTKEYMQVNWKGARIVRIRQRNAPGVIFDKEQALGETFLDDTRISKKLEISYFEKSPTSPQKKLYRLTPLDKEKCMTYFSFGEKTLHQKKRGVSCHKPQVLVISSKEAGKQKSKSGVTLRKKIELPPHTGQYPTPNALEIAVTLRQEQDDPDKIAAFVESLRYGFGHYDDWTTLPSPLFFERVVKSYVSAFASDEEEGEEELTNVSA
jgi:hypothetical protein